MIASLQMVLGLIVPLIFLAELAVTILVMWGIAKWRKQPFSINPYCR